jgi:hypothetical protein
MKVYHNYYPISYFDLKYKMDKPMYFSRYGIPSPYLGHARPIHDNELVSYVMNTVQNRKLGKESSESIDEIFKDRLSLIRSKIELILLQLAQRKEINQKISNQIDEDSCNAQNLIFTMDPKQYQIGRDRIQLERIKFDLERQRRMERASYFRDTGFLNKELKDTLIQYLDETQKSSLIGEMEEET